MRQRALISGTPRTAAFALGQPDLIPDGRDESSTMLEKPNLELLAPIAADLVQGIFNDMKASYRVKPKPATRIP